MEIDFTQGSIGRKLMVFSLPIMAGMLLQTAYNIVDAIYIGILGPQELAAVSLTFPVVFIFIAFASGLGIGANALIAQAIGRNNINAANNVAEHALVLGTGLGIVIAVLGIIFSPQIFIFMGANQEVLALTMQYAVPIFIGLIFMFAWFISGAILRAQGNSKTPMKTLAVSVVLNVIFSPILIFGLIGLPALGLTGAALATVFSRVVAALLNFAYIYTPKSKVSLALKAFKLRLGYIKQLLVIGLPASASQTLTAVGFILLMSIVGMFGSFAIAAFGVGLRINSVVIMPLIGLSNAVVSFVGQNIGAGDLARVKKVSWLATKIALAISLLLAAGILLFPEQLMKVFTQDKTVIEIGASFLLIVPFAYLFYGIYHVMFGAFQGAGKTELAFATNSIYWVLTIALAFFWSQSHGLIGVWWAMVVAAAIETVLVLAIFWSGIWLKKARVYT